MKIAYLTVKLPYGNGETFIIPEVKELMERGHEIILFPLRPNKEIFHKNAEMLSAFTVYLKIFHTKFLLSMLREVLSQPVQCSKLVTTILFQSSNFKILLKNMLILPKGFFCARLFRSLRVNHIHAHWASTPSSVAYIASLLSGIPWSFTTHRWDIAENNLLAEKVRTASFVRSIDRSGKEELLKIIQDESLGKKITIIHIGLKIETKNSRLQKANDIFTIMCPANLVAVKGHKYLLQACSLLARKGLKFRCLIAGEGYLKSRLKDLAKSLCLDSFVQFIGKLSNEKLIKMYRKGKVDLVVLASITTDNGEREGTPFALVEAMCCDLPTIATGIGGIPELLEGAGVLIAEKNPYALAEAIEKLMLDHDFYRQVRNACKQKVIEDFDISTNIRKLLKTISKTENANLDF